MRFIGIVHRVKKTAGGEARPTMVAILSGEKLTTHELENEQAELDFVLGKFPTAWEAPDPSNGYEDTPQSHLKIKKHKDGDEVNELHRRVVEGVSHIITKVATEFDGTKAGDVVAMCLGGSGDALAFALGRQAQTVGARVMRIPPFLLKERRDAKAGENQGDEVLLAELAKAEPELFYPLGDRDRGLISARECWRALSEAMKARIGCEQRLRQSFIGRIFTNPQGLYPEGGIEATFDNAKANSRILTALKLEEKECEKNLTNALESLDVYTEIFAPVVGVGPRIAARIIAAVVDIRRFVEEPANMEQLIAESYARSGEHYKEAGLSEDFSRLGGADAYKRINRLAQEAKAAGNEAVAKHLYAMLHEKGVRSTLRRKGFSLSASNLKAFMGVHLLPDGSFPRKRRGQVANWHGDARQALYLLMDQFFRRPDSEWGKRLRKEMADFRKKHPETVIEERTDASTGKTRQVKKYNDLHIRKMAMWRTANKFVEWLYSEWSRLEREKAAMLKPLAKAA